MTSIWLESRTRAILRSAEFGFLGVIVRTWRQTPRFCGAPGVATCLRFKPFQFLRIAGALTFLILVWRPWRTSWLIVGTKTLLLSSVAVAGRRSPAGGRFASGQARGTFHGVDCGVARQLGPGDAHVDRGPLPRPRTRSVSAPRKRCQTSGRAIRRSPRGFPVGTARRTSRTPIRVRIGGPARWFGCSGWSLEPTSRAPRRRPSRTPCRRPRRLLPHPRRRRRTGCPWPRHRRSRRRSPRRRTGTG